MGRRYITPPSSLEIVLLRQSETGELISYSVLNELEKEDVARSQKKKQADPSPTPKIEPALKGEPAKTPAESEPIEATSRDFF